MLFTQKALSALEYDKIIAMLAERALTEGARARALSLLPSADFETVVLRQKKTADAKRMLARKGYPPFSGVVDVTGAVERAEKGATLSTRELLQIAAVLTTARSLADYHSDKGAEDDNSLSELFGRLVANRTLETRILRAIPTDDFIADEASPELADIRRKIDEAGEIGGDSTEDTIAEARAILRDNDLYAEFQDAEDTLVVAQVPAPNEIVQKNTDVLLYTDLTNVDVGEENASLVTVPDVLGKTRLAANDALAEKGLIIRIEPEEQTGTAIRQVPAAGEEVAEGTEVLVEFSNIELGSTGE